MYSASIKKVMGYLVILIVALLLSPVCSYAQHRIAPGGVDKYGIDWGMVEDLQRENERKQMEYEMQRQRQEDQRREFQERLDRQQQLNQERTNSATRDFFLMQEYLRQTNK